MTKEKRRRSRQSNFESLVHGDKRSPTQIAAAANISRSYIYDLMGGGKRNPKPWVINRLAEALGKSSDYVKRCLAQTAREAEED